MYNQRYKEQMASFEFGKRQAAAVMLIAVIGLIGVTSIYFGFRGGSVAPGIDIANFSPVQVEGVTYSIYTSNYGLLGTVSGANTYVDASNTYPNGEGFSGQSFNSDYSGHSASPNLTLISTTVLPSGQVAKIYLIPQSISLGFRTYINIGTFNKVNEPISPYEHCTVSYKGTDKYYGYGTMSGILCFTQNCGVTGWSTADSNTGLVTSGSFAITQSLMGIDWGNVLCLNPSGDPYIGYPTIGNAETYLSSHNGNNPIIVHPTISLKALTNFIKYSPQTFSGALSNHTGVVVTQTASSAAIGFIDAYHDIALDQKGNVTNFGPSAVPDVTKVTGNDGMGYAPANDVKPKVDLTHKTVTSTGSVGVGSLITKVTTGDVEVHANFDSSLHNSTPSINLNNPAGNYGIPSTLSMTGEMKLQPITTLHEASMHVIYQSELWNGLYSGDNPPDDPNTGYSGNANIVYPYGIEVTNVAGIETITYVLAVICIDQVTMVTANGHPVNISQLSDFDVNGTIGTPSLDDKVLTITHTSTSITSIVWIIVGIVIAVLALILGIYIASYLRKRANIRLASQYRSGRGTSSP